MKIGLHSKLTKTLVYCPVNNGLYISHSFNKAKILSSNFISSNQNLLNYYQHVKKTRITNPYYKNFGDKVNNLPLQTEIYNPFNIIL